MEPNSEVNLFELQIDAQSNAHLMQSSKWAKFLAIVGFICCGLVLIYGVIIGSIWSSIASRADTGPYFGTFSGIGGSFFLIVAVIFCVLYFFPCLFLFRYASKMQAALLTNDQAQLINSFGNLKSFFKFLGILTIIGLSFFVLEILFVIIFAAKAVY